MSDRPGQFVIPYPSPIAAENGHTPEIPIEMNVEDVLKAHGGMYRRHLDFVLDNKELRTRFEEKAPISFGPANNMMMLEWNGFERRIFIDDSLQDWKTTFSNIRLFENALRGTGLAEPAGQLHDFLSLVIHKHDTDVMPIQMNEFLTLLVNACNEFCRKLLISLSKSAMATGRTTEEALHQLDAKGAQVQAVPGSTEWRMDPWITLVMAYVKEMKMVQSHDTGASDDMIILQ